ncbi:hypothetical protein DITRI_Ditri11bG0009100 [Diplodiscus trichospermus]
MVFFCHGYGDTCTFFAEGIARKLAFCGYGVFAMDYPGFGLSEGLHCYIPSFDRLVDDVIEQYSKVKENPDFGSLPSFLFGQSMGGAVALKMHLKQPNAWNGACLVAPMCKIADDMVPPWIVKQILIGLANFLPKQKLVPQKDLAEAAFRDIKKRELTSYNVIAYKDKPRLRTALEMLRTTDEIEQNLEKVSLPVLILHGENDVVTDPSVSKALYEKASSSDKRIIIYKDAGHSLLEGLTTSQIASNVFTLGTAAVLPFYTLMIFAPTAELTKKSMESSIPYIVLGLLYAYLLYLSWTPDTLRLMFASKYWLPELSGMAKMFSSEMTLASAWIHLLAVDLFAARQVFQDGLQNQVETRHSVSLCLLFCPIGIVTHFVTKALARTQNGNEKKRERKIERKKET